MMIITTIIMIPFAIHAVYWRKLTDKLKVQGKNGTSSCGGLKEFDSFPLARGEQNSSSCSQP